MPFTIDVAPTEGLTRVRFYGEVTGRDLLVATDALVEHPDYDASFPQLWSLAGVAALAISLEEMEALVSHDQALVEGGVMGRVRVGIVVTNPWHEAALRFYQHQMRSTGQAVHLFETEANAEAGLRALGSPSRVSERSLKEGEASVRSAA